MLLAIFHIIDFATAVLQDLFIDFYMQNLKTELMAICMPVYFFEV